MSETSGPEDAGRQVACRSCGNRVARSARRCPACGLSDPSAPSESASVAAGTAPRRGGRGGLVMAAVLAGAVAGAAVTAAVLLRRPVAPPAPIERRLAPPPTPAPQAETPSPPAAPEASRSRGRADWLFFFKPGDQLVRMSDDAPAGMVLRTEKRHGFADGSAGPAYLLQLPDGGGQRFVDADELERGARLQ
jgi:hypothetical protein